ncbi:hypothetical protein P261_00075 [Lachnospiraceae bacterium TWA4]|nr:hypothetical protein P261_00075 [Lachnospiraceae bacterium TWA4]
MSLNFEDLGDFFKDNSKKAVQMAKDVANTARITADIKSEELKLRSTYAEIGKLFCEHAEGEVDEAFVPLLQKVTECKAKIADLEAQQQKVKGMCICKECGAKSPEDSKYCTNCGAELVKEEAEVVDDFDNIDAKKTQNFAEEDDFEEE